MLDAVILGLTQGLTEFIPVSSSGHLMIMSDILGLKSDHLFLEFINIGTFLALIIFFRHKIMDIVKDVLFNKNFTLARNILITAIPAGVMGFLLSGVIGENWFFNSIYVVCINLLLVGVIMIILDKLPHASTVKDGEALSPRRALAIGLAQVFALIPGVSRLGSTMIAGRLSGLKPYAAAEYSFLVAVPIMAGVILKTVVGDFDYLQAHFTILAISNMVAFIVGMVAVGLVMKYLKNHSLAAFGWYRVSLATVILAVLLIR